ncbi:hypothetical protein Goshw_000242 [Gossypium schwendimanii]|uniref:Uncharacterized protein n=1 Tax=Gossypium schwendimanii TaxID=34291 RepID=A0A7J9KVP2_GOSSC|nr:hypothetical protein [Gossypium schwendimanii]
MLEGTKLEPALINAFVEKWRFETYISSSMRRYGGSGCWRLKHNLRPTIRQGVKQMCWATEAQKLKSVVAYPFFSYGHGTAYHFYVPELNIDASHVGIPDELEGIRLLLDQQFEAEKLDEVHKIDLRGKTDKDWPKFHAKYIYI